MRIRLCAVGRLRSGPERTLFDTYRDRFDRTGGGLGLGPLALYEVAAEGAAEEARRLDKGLARAEAVWALDERGAALSSEDFAAALAQRRDAGDGELAILIGGADGLAPELRARADRALSFGPMVWPHLLARAMLAEQLYRASAILAGSPYHRG